MAAKKLTKVKVDFFSHTCFYYFWSLASQKGEFYQADEADAETVLDAPFHQKYFL